MTLDEAIKHAEEVASRKFDDRVHCIKCAEEHRQLAEWLKDYKRLLEQQPCDDAISREAALEKMADYVASGYADSAEDFEEYSRIICQLPSITQKPIVCDDAISCEAVIEWLKAKDIIKLSSQEETARKELKALSPVTPQQKYGKWIAQQEVNGDDYFKAYDISGVMTYAAKYKCDKCGFIQICIEDHGQYNYCPKCGCRMKGEGK